MSGLRILIAGGGTGGHVYPAIAIADAIKKQAPDAEILFIGARGKLEMEKVPLAGYRIEALPVVGFQRRLTWRNLLFPIRLMQSWWKARQVVSSFRPHVAVGTGGYASGPALKVAASMGVPVVLQEQNAFAGVTNRLLARSASLICVAYEGMERYFPKEKILLTGNPVRSEMFQNLENKREEGRRFFGLDPDKPTVFLFGGSLGARTLNQAMLDATEQLATRNDVQWLWQTGRLYEQECLASATARLPHVKAMAFLDRMDLAYAAADVVVCRAGALSIAELCLAGKPALLVPSPNVAEDHQTRNAEALVEKNAARMLPDEHARQRLVTEVLSLVDDEAARQQLSERIRQLGRPDAAERIAAEVIKLARSHHKA